MTKQNTKLSGYNPNRRPSSMPSYLGLPRISSWKKFANLLGLDTPNKLKCDCFCTGRSMVEMLGVLAIVGVLSVGAIAGYSKAMFKYRLDKTVSEYNLLLTTTIEKLASDSSVFTTDSGGTLWYTSIFAKAGWLPDSFKLHPFSDKYALDSFGNNVWVFKTATKRIGIGMELNNNMQLCRSLFNLAKEWKSDLENANTDNGVSTNYAVFYGDKHCSSKVTCLANITLNNIDTACSPCEKQHCRFYFMVNRF